MVVVTGESTVAKEILSICSFPSPNARSINSPEKPSASCANLQAVLINTRKDQDQKTAVKQLYLMLLRDKQCEQ
jgi:hypothetical protein